MLLQTCGEQIKYFTPYIVLAECIRLLTWENGICCASVDGCQVVGHIVEQLTLCDILFELVEKATRGNRTLSATLSRHCYRVHR